MIYGTGVDIMHTTRLEALRGKYDDPFFKKTFSEKEYKAGMCRADPIIYFSERFAAKEAVFKALNVSSGKFRWNEIETPDDDSGKPYVVLHGIAKEICNEAGIRCIHISLSSDNGFVIAFAICET